MRANRIMWIDGHFMVHGGEEGFEAPVRLELRKDGPVYRWYTQSSDENWLPSGPCTEDTEVSAPTMREAIAAAEHVWGAETWGLRKTKRREVVKQGLGNVDESQHEAFHEWIDEELDRRGVPVEAARELIEKALIRYFKRGDCKCK